MNDGSSGYAALGGLERLTIVAGAVIIGYWGYRLYTAEKNAGLIFMGLAVLVLVGALVTGGSYLKSVGEGYQLASLPTETPAADSPFTDDAPAEPAAAAIQPAAPEPVAAVEPTVVTAEAIVEAPAVAPAEPETPVAPAAPEAAPEETAAVLPDSVEPAESPVRIATGAELGGRIVSVKSENVSLEWSPEASDSGSE